MIRIAQRAWSNSSAAEEMTAAVRLLWVEVDGVRVDGERLVSATVRADAGIQITTVELVGPAEFVYLNDDDEPVT